MFFAFFLPSLMHILSLAPSEVGKEEYLDFMLKSATAVHACQPLFQADRSLGQMFLHSYLLPLLDDIASLASNVEASDMLQVHCSSALLVSSAVGLLLKCDQTCAAVLAVLLDHADQLFAVQALNKLYGEWALHLDYKSRDLVSQRVQAVLLCSAQTVAEQMERGFEQVPTSRHCAVLQAFFLQAESAQLLAQVLTKSFLFLSSEVAPAHPAS